MKATSLTLRRSGTVSYQLTYWSDGIARFDGSSGPRQGAWQARIDPEWSTRVAKITNHLGAPSPVSARSDVVVIVESTDGLFTHGGVWATLEAQLWVVVMMLDGMSANTDWVPLATQDDHDFSPWASGVPMQLQIGDTRALALALSEGLLVLAGSVISSSSAASLDPSAETQRQSLITDGSIESDGESLKLTRHTLFSKPSRAASVLTGTNISGTTAWKDVLGRTWRQLGL